MKDGSAELSRLKRAIPASPLAAFVALLVLFACLIVAAFVRAVDEWTWAAWLILPLICANAIWISGGAATAVIGVFQSGKPRATAPPEWRPRDKTAVLLTICGENPEPVAAYLTSLIGSLHRAGMAEACQVFVLSDTSFGFESIREEAALSHLTREERIIYRRRDDRVGKKPGNIASWLDQYGADYDHMVVLDADSRMSASCIRHLAWFMESRPSLGLCQASISLIPGRTRFGKYQRNTSRLLARTFGQGFAAWSGNAGNYWGHNAIIRVAAFRVAANLPELSGRAPFGGTILSHDFVEAAWIRRAGWDVALAPNLPGSAEDAPQTLEDYFKRDRRWCQGNLQHLRLLMEPGLHRLSRFHLICGIFSYLAAPIWLILLALLSSGLISVWGFLPIVSIALVLFIPKICALIDALPRAQTPKRRRKILQAWAAELAISAMLAPVVMLRQAMFVGSVLMGRDCGWKGPERPRRRLPVGVPEALLGAGLLGFAIVSKMTGAFWLALLIIPLLSAPFLLRKLDEVVT